MIYILNTIQGDISCYVSFHIYIYLKKWGDVIQTEMYVTVCYTSCSYNIRIAVCECFRRWNGGLQKFMNLDGGWRLAREFH